MRKYLLDLLFCGYSVNFIFCKKNNKSVDNKKLQDNKKIQGNTEVSAILKQQNNDINVDVKNNQQVHSLKRMIENYPELASGFLDNLKAVNCQKSEESIVNLICKSKENIDVPNENKDNKSDKKSKKNKKQKINKDDVSIKKITKFNNIKCQGFLISNDGYIIADYSLMKGCNNVFVVDTKDITKEIPATIVGYDEYLSIILLKADIKVDKFIRFTEYDKSKKFKYLQKISKGEYKVDGYTEVEFNNTSTNNKKDKSKNKNNTNSVNTKTFNSYSNTISDIKTSVLINVDGYLVGMSVFGGKFLNNTISGNNSILPYNYIYKAVNEFISKKYYVHDYNIFGLVSVDERIKAIKRLKLDKGCVVETVSPRLERCGLKVNDIIVEVNGNSVNNIKEFDYIFNYYNSDEVKLKVNREGKEILLTLKDGICGNLKYEYINNGIVFNGATIVNIDKVSADSFNRSKNFKGGVLISDISDKTKWNCNSNFVITKIKDIPVKNVDDVINVLKKLNRSYKVNNDFDGISLLIEGFYTKDINNKKCFGILLK